METKRKSVDGGVDIGPEVSRAVLFTLLWDTLSELLGTAAVGAIVRRAARRAAPGFPELSDLVVIREHFEYRYQVPHAWSQPTQRPGGALRALFAEIGRLLVELTGSVVISRLEQIPELRAAGLTWRTEETN